MWQSTDQTESRSSLGSAASSSMPQPVDPAESSGGAVAPTDAELAGSRNQPDAASAQQSSSAPAPTTDFPAMAAGDESGTFRLNKASSGYTASYSSSGLVDDLFKTRATTLQVGEFIVSAPSVS